MWRVNVSQGFELRREFEIMWQIERHNKICFRYESWHVGESAKEKRVMGLQTKRRLVLLRQGVYAGTQDKVGI